MEFINQLRTQEHHVNDRDIIGHKKGKHTYIYTYIHTYIYITMGYIINTNKLHDMGFSQNDFV